MDEETVPHGLVVIPSVGKDTIYNHVGDKIAVIATDGKLWECFVEPHEGCGRYCRTVDGEKTSVVTFLGDEGVKVLYFGPTTVVAEEFYQP